jgi:hypothetical protein
MTPTRLLLVAALAGILSSGCGSESAPNPDTGKAADLAGQNELGVKPEGGVQPDGGVGSDAAKPDSGPAGKTVEVIYSGATHKVDVSKPQPVPLDGTSYARLSEVVLLALPAKSLATLAADFEAADGVKSSSKSNCATLVPVPGDNLAKGYVHPETLNMRWDDALGYPGCLTLKGLAKIILTDK